MPDVTVDFKILRGKAARWAETNPVLRDGEPGFETDTGILRVGNGYDNYLDLDYFLPSNQLTALIDKAISDADLGGGGSGGGAGAGVTSANLQAHINSLTPHPAYDDGPSFLLLYQNAKV